MALNNKVYDISQLAEITEDGFTAALFPQIRDAYALKMMEIYGNDIDISSASADGQFINMEALILNNIYRTLETIDRNMNPSTASGKYLDILCGFSNIYRQNETFSTCQVYIKNISNEDWNKKSIKFIDKNNLEWIWYNPINFERKYIESIKAGEVRTITVTCTTLGANMAYGTGISYGEAISSNTNFWNDLTKDNNGDIYQAIESGQFKVYQVSNAIPGKTRETDSQLRSKKLNLIGNGSQTILESLKSKLLSIEGISDCFVTHNVGGTVELDDGISVGKHHVYIALRYETGVKVSSWDIGSTIYKALTPGVPTQKYGDEDNEYDNKYGVSKFQKIAVTNNQTIDIYWKKCKANNPEIEITFDTKLKEFTPQQENLIKSVLKDFLNNIGLDDSISTTEIQTLFMSADLKNGGLSTYFSTGCSIEGLLNIPYKNHLTYCEYTNDDFSFDYDTKKLIIKTVEGEV